MPPHSPSKYHHFVPRLLLAGFTHDGTRHGTLHVHDRVRGRWRESSIDRAGGQNRLNDPEIEAALGLSLEGHAATAIRELVTSPHAPTDHDVGVLAAIFAIQQVRVPEHRDAVRQLESRVRAFAQQLREQHWGKEEADRRAHELEPMSKKEEGVRMLASAARMGEFYVRLAWSLLEVPARCPDLCIGSLPALSVKRELSGQDSVSLGAFAEADFSFLPITKRAAVVVSHEPISAGRIQADAAFVARLNWASACFAREMYAPAPTICGVDTSKPAPPPPAWSVG